MEWGKILAFVAGIMMLFFLWPAYKHHQQNSKQAEKGDWSAAIFAIGGVVLFVLLLIMSVR
jgi:heme O synthase-like polyprenyltransferase